MAYSELIKDFKRIRAYIREFYVYGFKSRSEYRQKSSRSYDNEKRRVESWLGDYVAFRQNAQGKNVFISVDGSAIRHNPLFRVFKTKSFTAKDILLHFYLMDLLSDTQEKSLNELQSGLAEYYPEAFFEKGLPDEKTIRNKLKELVFLGVLCERKEKKRHFYRLEKKLDLSGMEDAVNFFSEQLPLGVVGSFVLDQMACENEFFSYKHHYLMSAIDSEMMCHLLQAIDEKRNVHVIVEAAAGPVFEYDVTPLKIYISSENGRAYLLSWTAKSERFFFTRLDRLQAVKDLDTEPGFDTYLQRFEAQKQHLWGVSFGGLETPNEIQHLEMEIRVQENEAFIVQRLEREKRCGTVKKLSEERYLFAADVYDAMEMLPWISSFAGRVIRLSCSDRTVETKFYEDIRKMVGHYE